ncbi:MAG: Topoisomerase 1-associated factor 1 [Sclerophora amabilis]|nr:MAG: Topoisomerase 1-associated factor 1 [Sclerophora amabilis]
MEVLSSRQAVVDPEVQAYINSLVSALGGTGADENGEYVLGDDALGCLKDLKRWLKLYDEKTNRLDVSRCLAEANIVNGDLLPILASWPEDATEDRVKSKIALACLELLVPLTWPIEKSDLEITVNHHRHIPYLRLAQVSYKRGILNHDTAKLLRAAVRIALPSMAKPLSERSSREEGIIRLSLYYLRNVAMISTFPAAHNDGDENEVSRSATIEAFHYQDIFHLLLTISSATGEDFSSQDVVILEILFHLLKGVDIEKLFMDEVQIDTAKTDELKMLMKKEAGMLRGFAKSAPTRHNRFGTMIWIKRDDDRMSTVSGQDVLLDGQRSLAKIDKTKRWKKPKQRVKTTELAQHEFDTPVKLTASARRHLRHFVEDFLDAAFNPLFYHIRKAMDREADRILDIHSRQFFFLVSWFLEAERARRKTAKANQKDQNQGHDSEADSFSLIASILTQETFIALNRFMQESYDMKAWQDLSAGMRCFTQILLTVQEMSESPLEEDQIIAENIQNRIFYEETTHDRIVTIVQYYSNQGFGYLNACTEIAHVYLRMLERYAKQNVEMQVRSRRRVRKKNKAAESSSVARTNDDAEDDGADEGEEIAQAQRTTRERKFDFHRFAARFMRQGCVDTFVALTRYHQDLTQEQLKRAHRFFHRAAFKMEMSVMLFRLDIIALFHKMIKGPEGLDPISGEYNEWRELVQHIFRQLAKKMEQRPELAVELLFSKMNTTVFYLEHGFDKQLSHTTPRAPAELEVKPGMEKHEQIGVAVSILIDQGKNDALDWIKGVLSSTADERRVWEDEATARQTIEQGNDQTEDADQEKSSSTPSKVVTPDNEARRIAMFKDNKLRLLMTLVGLQRLGIDDEPQSSWIIPSSLTSAQLQESFESVKTFQFGPPTYDDDKTAEDFIRRKAAARPRRVAYDDDDSGISHGEEEDFLFPAGGPTTQKANPLEELKEKRRRRRNAEDSDRRAEPLNEKEREERAEALRKANEAKRRKIKSDLFVHDSDEEEDEERDQQFFEEEELRRREYGRKVLEALSLNSMPAKTPSGSRGAKIHNGRQNINKKRKSGDGDLVGLGKKKRKTTAALLLSDSDEADDGNDIPLGTTSSSVAANSDPVIIDDDEDEQDSDTDTPLSSPPPRPHLEVNSSDDDDEQDHIQTAHASKRIRKARSTSLSTPLQSPISKSVPQHPHIVMTEGKSGLDEDDDDEDAVVVSAHRNGATRTRGRARGGFVIESDSDE